MQASLCIGRKPCQDLHAAAGPQVVRTVHCQSPLPMSDIYLIVYLIASEHTSLACLEQGGLQFGLPRLVCSCGQQC